jgi:16S rRNA (cytosine1402-N4)-methyltransferase
MGQQVSSLAHTPVLLPETVKALNVQPGGRYIDCTVGGGGHAATILEGSSPGGQLLGLDADPEAVKAARARLEGFGNAVRIVQANFVNLEVTCLKYDFMPVNGILFDLGLSSLQLDSGDRGFSFQREAPLDMRFNPAQHTSAADIINSSTEAELAYIIRTYGEESCGYRIARRIVAERPLRTTAELARVVEKVVPRRGKIHPATRTFQALRIAVNHELDNLDAALKQAVRLLGYQGRLAVISYHSLEDRIVKRFMQQESRGCICPPGTPSCICHHVPSLRLVNRRVIKPGADEVGRNPRSRSAKLRVAERIITEEEWEDTADRLCYLSKTGARGWKRPVLLKKAKLKIASAG